MNYNKLAMPAAIVLAGVLISGAVIYSLNKKSTPRAESESASLAQNIQSAPSIDNVKPVSIDRDHILGNPAAPIKIVEYSDTECPFCKNFHETMHQMIQEYDGQVAWVYRHFPLHQIHPKAIPEAEATECVAELGGNTAFWAYLDRIFEITPSNNGLDLALLPEIAEFVGIDRTAFEECFNSRRHAQKIADNYNDAVNSGGRGTPYNVIIAPNGQKTALPGALPYSSVKTVLDKILEQNSN